MGYFKHLPTTSQVDVTANFEQIEGLPGEVEALGHQESGAATAEWPGGSKFSNHVEVNVGRSIVNVQLQTLKPGSGDDFAVLVEDPRGKTAFTFYLANLAEPPAKTTGLVLWRAITT